MLKSYQGGDVLHISLQPLRGTRYGSSLGKNNKVSNLGRKSRPGASSCLQISKVINQLVLGGKTSLLAAIADTALNVVTQDLLRV